MTEASPSDHSSDRSQLGDSDVTRRGEARAAILEATVRVLENSGEAAVRLASVADDAGVAVGLISYHFGGREGLIQAAQAFRYSRRSLANLDDVAAGITAATTPGDFLARLGSLTANAVAQASVEGSRMSRVALLGSAFGRPDLFAHYGEVQRDLTDQYERVARAAQENGLVRSDLDARAIGVFAQAYALGLVLADIDPDGPDSDALAEVILAAWSGLVATAETD